MMLKKTLIIFIFILICALEISHSKENENTDNPEYTPYDVCKEKEYDLASERCIIDTNLEPSYITAGAGINISAGRNGYGKWDDQIFEAELNQHLHFFNTPKTWVWKGFMKINPKVQLRMANVESSPVKTPGFLPRGTYFFWFKNKEKRDSFTYYSIMLSHHSNGQAGDFYTEDGRVNTDNGSFSTNFIELANYQYKRKYLPEWTKFSLQWHPGFNREDGLEEQYEELKIGISIRTTKKSLGSLWPKAAEWASASDWNFKLFSSISYVLAGRDYIIAPNDGFPQIKPVKADWYDNINVSLNLCVKPSIFKDMYLFIKYDFGYDYYNINFQHEFNRIQFGVAGDPFGILN